MTNETIDIITRDRNAKHLELLQAKCPSKLDLVEAIIELDVIIRFVEQCAPLQGDRITAYLALTLQEVSGKLNDYGYKLRDE